MRPVHDWPPSFRVDGSFSSVPFFLPVAAKQRPASSINFADYRLQFPSFGLLATEKTISEKREEAIEDAEKRRVQVGVDAAMATQGAGRTRNEIGGLPNGHAYALASADLFFTAGIAQYTVFFADIVGLSGSPPDAEIPSLTLLNGYTARLVRQNEINLREAWLRTELFGQRLALSAGRLDLTNYFDQNAFANDETTQFISDALVNNQMLGLSSNGTGVATEFDPKNAGRVVGGPAPRRLPRVPMKVVDGVLVAAAGFSSRPGFQAG